MCMIMISICLSNIIFFRYHFVFLFHTCIQHFNSYMVSLDKQCYVYDYFDFKKHTPAKTYGSHNCVKSVIVFYHRLYGVHLTYASLFLFVMSAFRCPGYTIYSEHTQYIDTYRQYWTSFLVTNLV